MARIRTIKPELPQSQTIGRLSRDARLLFIQLFTVADDAGRARAASRLLASLLYPYDDDAPSLIDGWLAELEDYKQIKRYTVDGSEYLQITKWLEHQKIDRPSPSRLPEFRDDQTNSRENSRASDADLGPSTLDLGPRTAASASAPEPASAHFDEFWKEYPRRDADEQRERAQEKFNALVKTGADPKVIIFSAKAYCAKSRKQNAYATRFVKQAWRWLGEQDFVSLTATVPSEEPAEPSHGDWRAAVKRWLLNESAWPRWAGNAPGSPACRCPAEILAECDVCPNTGRRIDETWWFAEFDTPELTANLAFAAEHSLRVRLYDFTIDGVTKNGAHFMKRIPPGYDEATGERIPASSEENAA